MFDNISLPSVEEVQKWTRTGVITFLKENADEDKLDLDDEDIAKIKKIRVTTASNQELQELKEKLTILQASKVREEVSIYFKYRDSEAINLGSDEWNSFSQLHVHLKNVFGLKGLLLDYTFSIGDKLIDLSWSKSAFIDYIEKHKCSANNLIKISEKKKAPSKLGEPEEWYKRQKTNAVDSICLNHCPSTASSSIPVSLLCPIFVKFKDLCDELSESEDNRFAYDFCLKMTERYNSELERQIDANDMLSQYLKRPIQPIVTKLRSRTDGTVCYGDGSNTYHEANIEYKKHNCGSDACPYLENCGYYLVFCTEKEMHPSYHNLRLTLIDLGPYFSVSGAMFANKAIVDPLTPVFPLIWQQYDEAMMVSIAKTFRALKISLQLLHQYYANVDELIQDEPQTVHLVHPSFPEVIIDNNSYMVQIKSQVSKNLLWEVTLLNEQEPHLTAYVKAVQKHRYSLDTHELLAKVGYASKIFATLVVPGNWILVYMEWLDNHSILHNVSNLEDSERNSLKKKIKEIVKYLHDLGHVHGDLREGNILVRQFEDNEFDMKLIDFEWSGRVGSARYSPFMNHEVQWPDGAEDWKLVTKNHDLLMLEQTLRKKNLADHKRKIYLETENSKRKAENAKLKAEVVKLRHDIEEIKLQTRVNTNEQDASFIEDISQSSACLESPVTLEAQMSTRGTFSNSLPIKDLSDKKYSVNVNLSQLKAELISLEDKKIDEFLDSKHKEKMIPLSLCDAKTVTKCHDQNYALDNSDTISIEISESDNQIVEGLIQEMTCNQTQSIVFPEINSISSNKSCIQDMIPGSVQSLSDLFDKAIKS
ncbi:hypothetical protein C2G38_2190957, partial [Gigaspora rosea]